MSEEQSTDGGSSSASSGGGGFFGDNVGPNSVFFYLQAFKTLGPAGGECKLMFGHLEKVLTSLSPIGQLYNIGQAGLLGILDKIELCAPINAGKELNLFFSSKSPEIAS